MKKTVVGSALIILLAVLLFSCSKKTTEQYPYGKYDIAYGGSACGSPLSIGSLKGFYAEEGLDITLVSGTTFEMNRNALAAGSMPIINGDFQFFPAIYNGIDVKLIAGLHEGCIKILVPIESDILTVKDLKGKRIGVDEIGGTPMSVASVAVGAVGIDPQTEIQWIPYPSDQEIQSLEKGEVDVIAAWDPFATKAEQTGKYRVLVDIAKDPLFAGRNCCFLFASGKLVKENPAAITAVLRALNKAIEYEGLHPREAAELLVKEKKVATDDVELLTTLLTSFNYNNHHSVAANANAKGDAIYFADWLTKIGYLPADLDVNKFIDDLYVDVFALEAAQKAKK
ncbi:MAG: ABC transporter substrate-binding protein [Spirochaetaceae bacterium]|jgi:NitT/TauT family transport system substrate-binding protein|nr:ABC transporter substrate-binding protein [Spirochaetaceae bacterium]